MSSPLLAVDLINLIWSMEQGHKSLKEAKEFFHQHFGAARERILQDPSKLQIALMLMEEYKQFYGWKE